MCHLRVHLWYENNNLHHITFSSTFIYFLIIQKNKRDIPGDKITWNTQNMTRLVQTSRKSNRLINSNYLTCLT